MKLHIANCKSQIHLKSGTILLEALIVFPLLLLMISGTFYIGSLIWTKQQVLIQDREKAWSVRHAGTPPPAVTVQPVGTWYNRASARTQHVYNMWGWLAGMLGFLDPYYSGSESAPRTIPTAQIITGRDGRQEVWVRRLNSDPLLQRQFAEGREQSMNLWWRDTVANANWPDGPGMIESGGFAITEHNRFWQYMLWSN